MKFIDIDKFTIVAYEFLDKDMIYQEQHKAALELLKTVLWDCYEIQYDDKVILEGGHGKPYFADNCVSYNVTHTKGLAACIICGNSEVGIDAELMRSGREKTIRKFMTLSEQEVYESLLDIEKEEYFFRIWTLKEALAKAYGTGIDADFAKREFKLAGLSSDVPTCSDTGFWYHQWKVSDGMNNYIISAALEK